MDSKDQVRAAQLKQLIHNARRASQGDSEAMATVQREAMYDKAAIDAANLVLLATILMKLEQMAAAGEKS